jgi:hypothetical protein
MSDLQTFTIGEILSITTGCLIAIDAGHDHPISGVYTILNYMTEDDLYTHQLPRAAAQCRPYLYEQFPWAEIGSDKVHGHPGGWEQFLIDMTAKHGKHHAVRRMHREDQTHIHPLAEAAQMLDGSDTKIISVDVDGDES